MEWTYTEFTELKEQSLVDPQAIKKFSETFEANADDGQRVDWIDPTSNLPCTILRSPVTGTLNGYVGVTSDHAMFGRNMKDADMVLRVHGGITFADALNRLGFDTTPPPHHISAFVDYWFFGFDTAHFHDFKPKVEEIYRQLNMLPERDVIYRDFEYVYNEAVSLAEQLSVLVAIDK